MRVLADVDSTVHSREGSRGPVEVALFHCRFSGLQRAVELALFQCVCFGGVLVQSIFALFHCGFSGLQRAVELAVFRWWCQHAQSS